MTNEEREALERLRNHREIWSEQYRDTQQGRDEAILANAYLREHPADDDELLNSTWVESAGLQFNPSCDAPYLYCNSGQWQLWLSVWMCLRNVNARGDVRRLCELLGIELKEASLPNLPQVKP